MSEVLSDPRFWVAMSFVVFFLLTGKKIGVFLTKALDDRSARIKSELDQAHALRREAEEVLAQYRKKQAESLKEAEAILANARAQAEVYTKQAEVELKAAMNERLKHAMDKIAREEEKAVQDVRNHVVDIALAAARNIIVEQVASLPNDELVKLALTDIEQKIH